MKQGIAAICAFLFILLNSPQLSAESAGEPDSPCLTSFFTNSLHYTGEGMRRWYEEKGGFMEITKIPYDNLDCRSCHVKSCDQCHLKKKRAKSVFKRTKAKDMNTCLPCHSREGLTFKFDAEQNNLDVHIAAGMVCAACHRHYDVHGDGRFRPSMRHPKGVRTNCRSCHVEQEYESPEFDRESKSHKVHGDKLDCSACHVRSTMACYNCHFDTFLKTGSRKGNFISMKSWLLLINYEGRVTSGSAMTLVYQNKKFIAYVPYFTHSVAAEGRDCDECHQNSAVLKIQKGENVPVVDFQNGRVTPWEGVVPVIEGKLDWVFLNRTEEGWEPVSAEAAPMVQFAAFGSPLTESQFRELTQHDSKKEEKNKTN
jgi:hypothetical protein